MSGWIVNRFGRAQRSGITLVELLVAVAVAGVVLSIVMVFFSFQTRMTRDTQARTELNVRTRSVLEAVVQDVKLAGARAVVDASGQAVFRRELDCDATASLDYSCVSVHTEGLEIEYISSLFLEGLVATGTTPQVPPEACRSVRYTLRDRTLYRSDVECGVAAMAPGFATELANDITSVSTEFVCGPGSGAAVSDPATCFAADGFVREARITVAATSPRPQGFDLTLASSTTTPNLRSAFRFEATP